MKRENKLDEIVVTTAKQWISQPGRSALNTT